MSRLGQLGIKIAGPKIIIAMLENENPEELAIECADFVDKRMDNAFGNSKSAKIESIVVPFLNKFIMAFNKKLLENRRRSQR